MRTKSILIAVCAVPLAVALAGCEHSKGMAGGPGDPVDPGKIVQGDVLASAAEDHAAAAALNDGKTLTADPATNSSTTEINFADNSVKAVKAASFAIKKNATGGMDMTVNGETVSFASTDLGADPADRPYGWEKTSGDYKGLYSESGLKDGSDQEYLQVWTYDTDNGDTGTRGVAVVGAETPESAIKGQANATYTGWAQADTRRVDDRKERTRVGGDLTLAADFTAGSVSGEVANLQAKERGAATGDTWSAPQAVAGKLIMGTAKIGSNGFSGGSLALDATASANLGANINGSTYSGRFYGPDADQVGGVMNIKGSNDDGSIVGSGYFVGYK